MIKYSQHIRWRERDGTMNEIGANNRDSWKDAIEDAMSSARKAGWTPPRWWQWWRWGDYDYSKLERQN